MMNICHVLEIVMYVMAIFLIIFMVHSIKKKEREDRRRADSYQFFQGHLRRLEDIYKNEASQGREWLYFGLNYGCKKPTEMKLLIDDLVKRIRELESCKRT